MSSVLSDIKKDYIISLLNNGKRDDGRNLNDMRDLKIELGIANNSYVYQIEVINSQGTFRQCKMMTSSK